MGASPSEQEFLVIDDVKAIAAERQASPAAVALAWVQGRAGVVSTLIGARRLEQLQDNLSSLTLKLTQEEIARLDQVTKPALNFPADVNEHLAPMLAFAGAKVDGRQTTALPWLTASSTRY